MGDRRSGKKSFFREHRSLLFFLGAFCLAVFFFRHAFLELGVKCALRQVAGSKEALHYDSLKWEEGRVVVSGLSLKTPSYDLSVDQLDVSLEADLLSFYLEPHLSFLHPTITLKENSGSSPLFLGIFPSRFLGVKLNVDQGICSIEGAPFYFAFKSSSKKTQIGTLLLGDDLADLEEHPLIYMDLAKEGDFLFASLKTEAAECSRLLKLASFFTPQELNKWETIEGQVEVDAKAVIQLPFQIKDLVLKIEASHLALENKTLGLNVTASTFHTECIFPLGTESSLPFWKKIKGNFHLEEAFAKLGLQNSSLTHLNAHVFLDPLSDPLMEVSAVLTHKEEVSSLALKAHGSMHEDHTFWVDGSLLLDNTETLLSLCSPRKEFYVAQAELKGFKSSQFKLVQDLLGVCSDVRFSEGIAEGKIIGCFKKGSLSEISCEELKIQNGALSYLPLNINGSFRNFFCDARVLQGELRDLHAVLEKGDVRHADLSASNMDADLKVVGGVLEPSKLCLKYKDIPLYLTFKEEKGEIEAELTSTSSYAKMASLFSSEFAILEDVDISTSLFFKRKKGGASTLSCTFKKSGEEKSILEWGCAAEIPSCFPFKMEKLQGWILAENLSPFFYAPFISIVNKDLSLKGNLEVIGKFKEEFLELSLQAKDVAFIHPLFVAEAKTLGGQKRIELAFDFKNQKYSGQIPLENASIKEKRMGLFFDKIHTTLRFENTLFFLENIEANYEGLRIEADAQAEFFADKHAEIKLVTTKLEGSAVPLYKLASSCGFLSIPLSGKVLSKENGFCLDAHFSLLEDPKVEWSFKGTFIEGMASLNPHISLHNLSFDMEIASESPSINIQNIKGDVWAKETLLYTLKGERLFKDATKAELTMGLYEAHKEVCYISCKSEKNPTKDWKLCFASNSHIFGSKLNVVNCLLKEGIGCTFLEMKPTICAQSFKDLLPLLNLSLGDVSSLKLQGELPSHIIYNALSDDLLFYLESKNLQINNTSFKKSVLKGKKTGLEFLIQECSLDDLGLKAAFIQGENSIEIPQFEISTPKSFLKGDAEFFLKDKTCKGHLQECLLDLASIPQLNGMSPIKGAGIIKGDFFLDFKTPQELCSIDADLGISLDLVAPFALKLKSEEKIHLRALPLRGFTLDGLNLISSDKTASLRAKKLEYDGKLEKWKVSNAKAFIPVSFIPYLECEKSVLATLDAEWDPQSFSVNGSLNDGSYGFSKLSLPLKQILFKWDPKTFILGCKLEHEKKPFFAQLHLDFSKETLGMLKIQEDLKLEGIKILFKPDKKKGIDIHSIGGVLSGLDIQMKKLPAKPLETAFTGKISIDGIKALELLPKMLQKELKDLKLGKGYTLEGAFILKDKADDPFHFEGTLKGNMFSIFGIECQRLEAEFEASSKRIYIGNVHVLDASGNMEIREIKLDKAADHWNINIPLIQLKDFTPSLMAQEGGAKPKKPFCIRNLSLFNVCGSLSDLTSLKGSGHFIFTNQDKKTPHFLDVPLDIIKSWGLDLGLLTPIQGEIELQLIGDKVYFSELKNMFSEGKRSEFYLASENSYVDLKGNMHIDLKMRQDVALKLTEPFVLTVRGTLKKPRYGFGT